MRRAGLGDEVMEDSVKQSSADVGNDKTVEASDIITGDIQ